MTEHNRLCGSQPDNSIEQQPSSQELGSNPKTQFTPGPWKMTNGGAPVESEAVEIYSPDHSVYWLAYVQVGKDLGEANAHLIAAAPEMYEALRDAVDALDKYSDVIDTAKGPKPNDAMRAIATINQILRKAEGRSL